MHVRLLGIIIIRGIYQFSKPDRWWNRIMARSWLKRGNKLQLHPWNSTWDGTSYFFRDNMSGGPILSLRVKFHLWMLYSCSNPIYRWWQRIKKLKFFSTHAQLEDRYTFHNMRKIPRIRMPMVSNWLGYIRSIVSVPSCSIPLNLPRNFWR